MKVTRTMALATVVLATGILGACSSTPKQVAEPNIGAAVSKPAEIVQTPRGPSLTLENVLFDFEKSSLRPEARDTVAKAVAYLNANPERNALIEGHADATGDASFNKSLSNDRALAIQNALMSSGISSQRIEAYGKGELQPVADNQTLAGRQANRRVEIIFTEIE